jgi:hypothetical protein
MPTARELLEQADALMRRNRAADASIPVLTDVVEDAAPPRGPSTRERIAATREQRPVKIQRGEPTPQPAAGRQAPAEEPPLLTDAVEELAVDIPPVRPERESDEHSAWLGPDTIDPSLHSITGPAPDTVAVVPPVTLRAHEPPLPEVPLDEPDPTITRTLRAAGSAATPAPAGSISPYPAPAAEPAAAEQAATLRAESFSGNDDERWRALAEQISMQVLQRIDLFTDTGLKAQLATHLQPIVARASDELVEAINEHVGKLVRSYVAEAIEREIAQWREQQR